MHDDVLREGSELGHAVEVLAVERVTPGAVGDHRTGQGGGTKVTDVLTTGGAVLTLATGRDEGDGDVVAGLEARDVWSHGLHDAGTFVSTDDGEHGVAAGEEFEDLGVLGDVTGAQVLIGVTHTREGHLDLYFIGLRLIDFDDLGRPGLIKTQKN